MKTNHFTRERIALIGMCSGFGLIIASLLTRSLIDAFREGMIQTNGIIALFGLFGLIFILWTVQGASLLKSVEPEKLRTWMWLLYGFGFGFTASTVLGLIAILLAVYEKL